MGPLSEVLGTTAWIVSIVILTWVKGDFVEIEKGLFALEGRENVPEIEFNGPEAVAFGI